MRLVKNIVILFFMWGLFPILVLGQSFCSTPALQQPENRHAIKAPSQRNSNAQGQYLFRVYFHIIRYVDGTGGVSSQIINTAYSILNADFNQHGIYFYWDGAIDYINRSDYRAPTSNIFSINNHTDGIDIYVYPNVINSGYLIGGLANGFGQGTEILIAGTYTDVNGIQNHYAESHVISHEMGHVLNLYHTHHGTYDEGGGGTKELVDGSNSAISGDFVTDTPADPNIAQNINKTTCAWTKQGLLFDANNMAYNPNTHLIMSYTTPDCMEYFTPKQAERIKDAVDNFLVLQNAIIQNFLSIFGLAIPVASATYNVAYLPNDCSVSWSFSGIPVGLVIAEDSPVVNRCTINNTNKQYINGTLTATITKDGAVIATPTKVLRTGANFAGTYSAASRVLMSPANTSLIIPAIATTDFADDDVLHVWAGTTVTLSSAKFQDAIVTHTGGTLASWVNNNNGTITLSFPLSSYYDSIMVTGVPNNSYETYRFKIVAMGYGGDVPIIGDDNPLSPIQLSAMGSMYSLSLSSQYVEALSQKEGAMPQWNISIVNSITGQLQYENSIKGSSTTVDATNWPTGVYAVYVKVANEVFTRKFAVK